LEAFNIVPESVQIADLTLTLRRG